MMTAIAAGEPEDNRGAVLGLDDSTCNKLAMTICSEIRESEREKEPIRLRWIRLREIHDVQESTSQIQLIEGMKSYVLPLSREKVDRIVGSVVDGITGISPYVQVKDAGNENDNLDLLSDDLMVLAEDAGDITAIRQGTEDACLTNAGVWRVRPLIDEDSYDTPATNDSNAPVTGIDWEALDPIDVCCYPPYYGTFESAKTVGHRWSEMVYRVKRDMVSGNYAYYDLKGGDDPMKGHRTHDNVEDQGYEAQEMSDQFVELWQVITEIPFTMSGDKVESTPGKFNRFLAVVALTEQKLLSLQNYPYSQCWYVQVRTEPSRKRIFPSSSVAQRLQGLQLSVSDAYTMKIQAAIASIGPVTFATGGAPMAKVISLKPFGFVELTGDVKIQSFQANPQIGGLESAMQDAQESADALTGISRNGVGQQMPASTTATEINALQQAQSAAEDAYTQVVAESVEPVFKLILEYYRVHYDDLKQAYGERLTADPQLVQTIKPGLSVNGKNGTTSSVLVIQKLQMLFGMIMQTPTDYDPVKVIDLIAQMLDFPVPLDRLKKDPNPLDALLKMPQMQQMLMSGEPLPQLLQEIQQRAQGVQGQQPGGPNVLPGQPNMGSNAGMPPGATNGANPPMLNSGPGPNPPPSPGAMPGL